MARSLSPKLMAKLRKGGELYKLITEIAKDKELTSEIRDKRLTIYFQKRVILNIYENKIETLRPGFYKDCIKFFTKDIQQQEIKDSLLQEGPVKFNQQNPKPYFAWAKKTIKTYNFIGGHNEFILQQRILKENSSKDSNFFVLDLEYQFEQGEIPVDQRIDISRIDIVAIEKMTNDIVLFELKQGTGAVEGDSGIEDHIRKTYTHIANPVFCERLRADLSQILSQKLELGLLDCDKEIITNIQKSKIKMGFVFVTDNEQDEKTIVKLMKGHEDILTIWKDYSCELYVHHHPSRN